MKGSLAAIFLFSILTVGFTQDPHPAFKHYTVKDGLANPDVYQVKQDSKGYIWFATSYGVSLFNGYEFENFTTNEGLPDNTVFEIFEDYWGRIWFLPLSCKLSFYYQGKIHDYPHNDTLAKLVKRNLETSFYVDEKGTVFLGIVNDGMYEIAVDGQIRHIPLADTHDGRLNIIEPAPGHFIYSFMQSEPVKSMNFNTLLLKSEVRLNPLEEDKGTNRVRMIRTHDDHIVIAFEKKIIIMDQWGNYVEEYFPHIVTWLYEDQDGDLWVGTFLKGIFYIPGFDFKRKKNYLSHLSIDGILQDFEGGFWFSTEGSEVYYAASKQILTYDQSCGLQDNKINCIINCEGDIYAGAGIGGVIKITKDNKVETLERENDGTRDNVARLYFDYHRDLIWVSGHGTSDHIKNDVFLKYPFVLSFYDVLHDSASIYWVASTSGLSREDMNDKEYSLVLLLPLNRVSSLIENTDNTLWLGTGDGLWKFYKKDSSVVYWGEKYPLLKNRILDMDLYKDTLLVIGTKGAGLLFYDGSHVVQMNNNRGLSNDHVHKILVNDSTIWVATSKGINRLSFDPLQRKMNILKYTTEDGLPSDEINDIVVKGNELWVASTQGISYFNPDSLQKRNIDYPVYIDWIKVNNKRVDPTKELRLDYDQNTINIHYTGLGYKNAGNLNYRYKLVGLDTNWVYTKNREIQFTTLPANNYRFIVEVQKNNGEWGSVQVSLPFVVYAPFWKKWWFSVMLLLYAFVGFYAYFRYRFRKKQKQLQKEEEINRQLLELKSKALRAQMNPHFTFNVMNSIQHYIINNNKEAANKYMSKFSKLIRLILNHSEQNRISLSDEIKALTLYIELEQIRFEESFDYSIIVSPEVDADHWQIPSMIIQPYVENAIKHGILPLEKKGDLKIEFLKLQDSLKCIIQDNGIGRKRSADYNQTSEYNSMGTHITQERIEVMNNLYRTRLKESIIDLYDEKGDPLGTRVEIEMSLKFINPTE